ncbi:MAG: PLP-dependent aminotransferase family protein [Gemmatimonadetes bacterium]|nr:PLP-dependent aminotransferase family protein [Gemmatimonadota bacterium]
MPVARSRARSRRFPAREAVVEIPVAPGRGAAEAPLYTQLYRRLRDEVLSGSLKPGARLPSARTLAADLRLSRNTVEAAIRQLTAEGFVVRRIGSGTTVATSLGEAAPFPGPRRSSAGPRPPVGEARPIRPNSVRLSERGRQMTTLGQLEIATEHPHGPCSTDVIGFPARTWNRMLARRARRSGSALFLPGHPRGHPALRAAIVEHARLTRGVRADPDQVVVVSSTQQAIDLAARLLLDPGSIAVMEEPGYRSARSALQAAGAVVRGVRVDGDGLDVDRLAEERDARLVYVTPSHQFPLGVTLSLPRRLALLQWAATTGAWIIEDDYDSEFRYQGRPIASLQGLDRADRVLYVGTCNKVLFPGLRLAYLIVPPPLVDPFAAARRVTDGFSPTLIQAVLADFMTAGHFAAYLRLAKAHYAECRDVLVERMARTWGDRVRPGPSDTGLHLVGHLPNDRDDAAIAARALPNGVGMAALSGYYLGRPVGRGLLLSYGATTPAQIVRSVDALGPWL